MRKKLFNLKIWGLNHLATLVLLVTLATRESFCIYIFHQPECPDGIEELKWKR